MSAILKFSHKISKGNVKCERSIFLIINILVFSLTGFAVWGIVRIFFGAPITALVCAVGYPAIFAGLIGGVLYLMNRDLW